MDDKTKDSPPKNLWSEGDEQFLERLRLMKQKHYDAIKQMHEMARAEYPDLTDEEYAEVARQIRKEIAHIARTMRPSRYLIWDHAKDRILVLWVQFHFFFIRLPRLMFSEIKSHLVEKFRDN